LIDGDVENPSEKALPSGETGEPRAGFPLNIQITGIAEEAQANAIGGFIHDLVTEATGVLDLSALEKVWLTNTYRESIASVDRGFETTHDLSPTNEEFASGVAMVVHVKRGDELKCQLVAELGIAWSAMYAEEESTRLLAVGTLVHELAHVHDFACQCRMFPDLMFKPIPNTLQSWLYNATNGIWSEYFACWFAAPVDPAALNAYIETFLKALDLFPEEVRQEIIAYRTHGDLDRLLRVASARLGSLCRFAGYVIGHLEGLKTTLPEARPEDWSKIESSGFATTWTAIRAALVAMHETYPDWTELDAYDALGQVFRAYLGARGIELGERGTGFNVKVPFTRDTIPAGAVPFFDLGHRSLGH
jgi:hypothetical protein